MEFPKTVRLGRRNYLISTRRHARKKGTMAEINYALRLIEVATHSAVTGVAYKREDVHDSFWHEMTHAILHEMRHPLRDDEKFVTRFANLLTQAIRTAKF